LPNFTLTPLCAEKLARESRWGPNEKSVRVFGECPEPTKVRSHPYLFPRTGYVQFPYCSALNPRVDAHFNPELEDSGAASP